MFGHYDTGYTQDPSVQVKPLIKQNEPEDRTRRPYTKPTVESLGLVREITLAGTGDANESAGTNTMCADPVFDVNLMCEG